MVNSKLIMLKSLGFSNLVNPYLGPVMLFYDITLPEQKNRIWE